MQGTGLSSLPQEALWRVTALLHCRSQDSEEVQAQIAGQLVPAIRNAVAGEERLVRMVVDRAPDGLSPEAARLFPPLFDAMIEFWFEDADDAGAVMAGIAGDLAVRSAAEAAIDDERSILWLAQAFPIKREEGRSRVKFLAGGDAAEGWNVGEAQRYWRDVHPDVARKAPTVWEPLTRYVQFHGRDIPAGASATPLGRWRQVPMCAEMGFADDRDFVANYSSEEYRRVVRPDEEKFSRPGEMLAFVSGEERVVAARG